MTKRKQNDHRARRMGDLTAEIANTDPAGALELAEMAEAVARRHRSTDAEDVAMIRALRELDPEAFEIVLVGMRKAVAAGSREERRAAVDELIAALDARRAAEDVGAVD